MIRLRPYQTDGLDALWNYFQAGNTGNPLLAWPCGTGKSIVPAIFIESVMRLWPTQRFLLITHVKELIDQNYKALLRVWFNAPVGIYSAGLKSKETAQSIIYGGIQSMIKNPMQFGFRDIIFIDEAHLISDEDSSMYVTFLAAMKLINPHVKIIGLTATPYRMGMGLLTEGKIFTHIVHDLTSMDNFNKLVSDGYLAPLIPLRTKIELDTSDVSIDFKTGDFAKGSLQKAVDKQEITFEALRELVAAGQNRRSWLIFSSGIEHAEHIAEMLGTFGIDCAPVHSKRDSDYNDAALAAFKNYELRSIVSYSKITTGFDHVGVDLIGDLMPTLSIPRHVQKYGRGERPVYADGFDLDTIEGRLGAIAAGPKQNCICEGTMILTDSGLVPIEKITNKNLLWDGYDFVSHDGVICNGYREVIKYEGLIATKDHLVWTEQGWKKFYDCFKEKCKISVTGNGRKPIRQIENNFRRSFVQRTFLYSNRMYYLQKYLSQRNFKFDFLQSWLSSLRQFAYLASTTKMVTGSLRSCKRSLHEFKQSSLQRLWWPRGEVYVFSADTNGNLGNAKLRASPKVRIRQNRKQRALSSWKFKIFDTIRKFIKSPQIFDTSADTSVSTRLVFDILNCGPRNQFTANGLLVHNCLVLDYARNTPRLGPINDPQIPRKKGEGSGEVPIKICDACGAYNHTRVQFCCKCGNEFTFQIKFKSKAGTEELIRTTKVDTPIIEDFNVERVLYHRHVKINKKTKAELSAPMLKVQYLCGLRTFNEYVHIQGTSLMLHKAHEWWKMRAKDNPPATTDEALSRLSELRVPRKIKVHVNKDWPDITGVEW